MTYSIMWPLSRPKTTASAAVAADKTIGDSSAVVDGAGNVSSRCDCCCLVTKLMRRLKKRRRQNRTLRSSSRYDPLSYSLNFDDGRTGSCGGFLDEDYYRFYAFSSRFAANIPRASSCPVVPVTAEAAH